MASYERPTILLTLFRWPSCGGTQSSPAKRALLHEGKENRDKNQDMNRGGNHAADNGRGDGFHHVRADSGFPEDGDQAGQDRRHGHELWAEALHSAFDRGGFDVLMVERDAGGEALVERLMKIDDHD